MNQITGILEVDTTGSGLYRITPRLVDWIGALQADTGLLTLLCQHS